MISIAVVQPDVCSGERAAASLLLALRVQQWRAAGAAQALLSVVRGGAVLTAASSLILAGLVDIEQEPLFRLSSREESRGAFQQFEAGGERLCEEEPVPGGAGQVHRMP